MPDLASPSPERTSSAIMLAEQTIGGSYSTIANGDSPSVIAKAMEYAQPGSSKRSITKAPEAPTVGEEVERERTKRSKKKSKKDKARRAESILHLPRAIEPKNIQSTNSLAVTSGDIKGRMKIAVKHLEERYDEQGYTHIIEAGAEPPEKSKEDKWPDYILCELRHFDYEHKFDRRTLEIKSNHLKEFLRNFIGEYPGISFKTDKIKLDFPLRCLYHYLDDLTAELEVKKQKQAEGSKNELKVQNNKKDEKKKSKKDSKREESTIAEANRKTGAANLEESSQEDTGEAIEHLEFFIQFISNEFQETIADCKNLLPHGLITYEHLWTIFKPGMTVFTTTYGEHRALKITRTDYVGGRQPAFHLELEYVDYDGKSFGLAAATIPIYVFEGSININALNAFPLDFHSKEDTVKKALIERGRKFEGYRGRHNMEYKGISLGEVVRCRRVQYNINGRVMVDSETYNRINPERSINLQALSGDREENVDDYSYDSETSQSREKCIVSTEHKPLTDEQCLLAHFLVSGFALGEKKWVDFYIDKLTPIDWNANVFDQLVLPASQKSLVKALVESHVREGVDGFDDIIRGKGKGLISILHGPPGVGKTLTAESVAEHTRRPLYAVSSGELGTNPTELEENLSRILDVATVWKAVLLLDEADVFLEKRSLHDLKRNSLVSIFLRLLEYYQGILFLTSNRVTSFDEAFQSRIHVALKYNKLDEGARTKVWRNFMKFDDGKEGKVLLGIVAERELNGRQIKNCVRTARSLAEAEGREVGLKHLMMVLDIQEQFEKDFGGLMSNGVE